MIASVLIVLSSLPGLAQTSEVTVPDLTGLNVPQAAAALNRAGLRLGDRSAQAWTAAASQPAETIVGQDPAAGQSTPSGTAVSITLLSAASVSLLYDDNDLTLINNTGGLLDLNTLTFSGTDGTRRFLGSQWGGLLEAGDCTQLWSVGRNQAKEVTGCDSIFWQTTNVTSEHFWTQSSGAGPFQIVQNGEVVATCEAAPLNSQNAPLTCAFFVAVDAARSAPYVYMVYTTDRFAVINATADAWMPLDSTQIAIPGLTLTIGDPALFGSPDIVADLRRLAPEQCTLLTLAPLTDTSAPEPCNVIAQSAVPAERAFWRVDFEVLPSTRPGERLLCPAAVPNRVTLCVMPR